MISLPSQVRFCVVLIFALTAPCFAQLERCFEAHGGIANWRRFGAVEYDLSWAGPKGVKKDHQFFNLRTRAGLIAADKYTLGTSQGEVWVKPGLDALGGTPPRFYMWTPFYFFGIPFVFADPGATQEPLGRKSFQGREYEATRITFKPGTGDSPDDHYVAYVDPASGTLKLAHYVVTFPSIRKGKPIEQLEEHAIVFEEWQRVDGLLVPKVAPFYKWKDENIEGEALGRLIFSAVHFAAPEPNDSKFKKPADAVVAPLP